MTAEPAATTVDAFLGGKVEAIQPKQGHHRSGLEAMLLSAAVEADFAGTVVDLGAGVGVAGMAIAARCAKADVTLVEREPQAIACAREALARPANAAFAARVSVVVADIEAPESERVAAGLHRGIADTVVMNPPFYEAAHGTTSADTHRAAAHVLADTGLDPWLRAAASALKSEGRIFVVFRAERLQALLAGLDGRFGAISILPVHPRGDIAAGRLLVEAKKGSRAPLRILPSLVLHPEGTNTYLPPMERILRHGASLSEVHPAWAKRGE